MVHWWLKSVAPPRLACGIIRGVNEPQMTAAPGLTLIGSVLALTSGALVAVQVGLWVANSFADGVVGPQSLWVSVLMSAGMLVLGLVMFLTALVLLSQGQPTRFGRRAASWAGVGFVAMAGWAVGIPMVFGA